MEIYGILFAAPMAFFATLFYAVILALVIRCFKFLKKPFFYLSFVPLSALAVDIILILIFQSPANARQRMGPIFEIIHTVAVLGIFPSITNIFLLRGTIKKRQVLPALLICTLCAMPLALFQIYVAESLYGVYGLEGPLSVKEGELELVNQSGDRIVSGQIDVCNQDIGFGILPSGESIKIPFGLCVEGDYKFSLKFESGKSIEQHDGYVMSAKVLRDRVTVDKNYQLKIENVELKTRYDSYAKPENSEKS